MPDDLLYYSSQLRAVSRDLRRESRRLLDNLDRLLESASFQLLLDARRSAETANQAALAQDQHQD